MSSEGPSPEPLTPAEERLHTHLELLRVQPPRSDRSLVQRVVRAAGWQREVRAPLRIAGFIAAAIVDGLALLVGAGSRRRRR